MISEAPQSATLYAFNVGFGDCFLLRFQYAEERRHVLIDFGSTRYPDARPKKFMKKVAEQIKDRCGGSLDVVVATHRHKDHIGGFATKDGDASGDIIRSCNPKVVLQPWTEHPDAEEDALASPDQSEDSRAFVRALRNMERVAAAAQGLAEADAGREVTRQLFSSREREVLSFLGENNIKNPSAVKNLMTMGQKRPRYLAFGDDPRIDTILPGVHVEVLGPPTLTQSEEIRQQRARNQDEYWHLQAASAGLAIGDAAILFRDHVNRDPPPWTRWGQAQLRAIRKETLLSIVTQLDDAMNNTSLILLFTVGDKSLLFPGDAQWENWSYALSQPEVQNKLRTVDLYKVGHHGSLNATPKSLWRLFENRSKHEGPERLVSVLSTKHGVHGHSCATAVPRTTLVAALSEESQYYSTEDLELDEDSTVFYTKVEIDFSS